MKTATLAETKNNLSALIDQVRHGETIVVVDRGRPVAHFGPVSSEEEATEDRLARLQRQGILRRALYPLPRQLLNERPPAASDGASIVAALLAERGAGR
ncbi:MAG: type II toxin-antitoxin system Phd/YefM family antitoxin [bacterium]|nr:type II toxin-antitoxin system Phd/YefM family antitoxin [bacterium]